MGAIRRPPSQYLASRRLVQELYHLSKADLFELVVDYARQDSGHADDCTDDEVITLIKDRAGLLKYCRQTWQKEDEEATQ